MTDKLLEYLLPVAIAGYFFKMWLDDYQARASENAPVKPIPGATSSERLPIIVGIVGALIILGLETGGEIALGVSNEQKTITVLFLLPMLAAAVTEEIVFRGFLVVENRGRAALVGSILVFSLIFALFHDFLWSFEMPEEVPIWMFWQGDFSLNLNAKGFFSTGMVFLNGLWFYYLRFMPANRDRSLIPCFVAHAVSNLGVFAIKAQQGFVEGIF